MWANQKPFHQMLVVEWVCSIIGGVSRISLIGSIVMARFQTSASSWSQILYIYNYIYIYPHFISFYQRTCSKEFQHFPNVSQSAPMIPPEFSNVFPNLFLWYFPQISIFAVSQIFSPDGSPEFFQYFPNVSNISNVSPDIFQYFPRMFPRKHISRPVSPRPFSATMPPGTGCWTWLSWPARWRRRTQEPRESHGDVGLDLKMLG